MVINRLSAVSALLIPASLIMMGAMGRDPASSGHAAFGPLGGGPAADEVPPFHPAAPPRKGLPATLDPLKFADAITRNSYAMAGKIKAVLYQQPCYCHCDREYGHASLLDCFTGTHAAVCNICKAEAIYAFNETARKRTAAQIREGIINGESQKIDLAKYREYKPPSD